MTAPIIETPITVRAGDAVTVLRDTEHPNYTVDAVRVVVRGRPVMLGGVLQRHARAVHGGRTYFFLVEHEGVTWIRGHWWVDSPELLALRAAYALSVTG